MARKPLPVRLPTADYFMQLKGCQASCPVYTDANGYVQAIAAGDFREAYRIARAPNPLASICGRVCGAPCEDTCSRGRIDQPIQIRALKRFATERFGPESDGQQIDDIVGWLLAELAGAPPPVEGEFHPLLDVNTGSRFRAADGQRVAIIGSGPAGVAAAHDLALLGFRPVILEREKVSGGMLALGIPEYRLPRRVVEAELQIVEALGVEFQRGVEVGKDVTLPELREQYDAVVIATGAPLSRELLLPDGDSENIVGGVEFLRDVALGQSVDLGGRVLVIGGGNVAFDVGRSVVRSTQSDVATLAARYPGVAQTTVVCLESRAEMPADEIEILEGIEEGITVEAGWGPKEVHVSKGKVCGVTFVRCTRVFDETHRFHPVYDDDERLRIDCDAVLLAIGQRVHLPFIDARRDGIELTASGAPVTGEGRLETSAPNVFVAGDLAHGTKLAIHAIASGKQVAREIYERIVGETIEPDAVRLRIPLPSYVREYDYESWDRIQLPVRPADERVVSQQVVIELSLEEARARYEASRCLNCRVNPTFYGERCVLCGGCADVCPAACLRLIHLQDIAPESLSEELRYLAEEGSFTAIVKNDEACLRCGLCAARCPTDAVIMEQYNDVESVG